MALPVEKIDAPAIALLRDLQRKTPFPFVIEETENGYVQIQLVFDFWHLVGLYWLLYLVSMVWAKVGLV